jgi:hypothetical protein
VSREFSHESIAESANFSVRAALWVKVRTTLSAAHVEAGQGVFEDLLISKELEDRQVHSGMESQTSLVWTECRVKLHSVSAVDLEATLVILPHNAELNHALRDGNNVHKTLQFGMLFKQLLLVFAKWCILCR